MGKKNKNKPERLMCVMHAASDAVKILEVNGWRCCAVGSLAAMLHGGPEVPDAATLVVLPTDGGPTPLSARQILLNAPGQNFRPRDTTNVDTFVYLDPRTAASDIPARRQCEVRITTMNQLLAGFRQSEIQRVNELPVAHPLPLLVYEMEAIINKHGQRWADKGQNINANALGCLTPDCGHLITKLISGKEVTFIGDKEFRTLAFSILPIMSKRKGFRPFVDHYLKQMEVIEQSVRQDEVIKQSENVTQGESVGEQKLPLTAILDGKDAPVSSPVSEATPVSGSSNGSTINSKPYQKASEADLAQPTGTTTQAEAIFSVAVKVVHILCGLGFRCAILGTVLAYEGNDISNKINVAIFRPSDATPSDVRRTLMTSLWYHHFHLKRTGDIETLYFLLKTIGMKIDAIPRNMIAIDIFTPASLSIPTLGEEQIVDLPVIPSTVLSGMGLRYPSSPTLEGSVSRGTERESSQVSFNSEDAIRLKALFSTWNSLGGHREASKRHGFNDV